MGLRLLHKAYRFRAFGFTLESNLPLSPWLSTTRAIPDVIIECKRQRSLYRPKGKAIFTSPYLDYLGRSQAQIFQHGKDFFFDIPLAGNFLVEPHKITIFLKPSIDLLWPITYLLSHILAFWMELKGIRSLHACGIVLGEQTCAFIAESTGGKSTLAAAFIKNGATLLSDDLVPIEKANHSFFLRPGYATLRMDKEQLNYFLDTNTSYRTNIQGFNKTLIKIGKDGWADFCDMPRKADAIYLLQRLSSNQISEIQILPIFGAVATMALLRRSFVSLSPLAIGTIKYRIAFFADVVERVPIKQIIFPNGYEYLPAICQAVMEDLHKH